MKIPSPKESYMLKTVLFKPWKDSTHLSQSKELFRYGVQIAVGNLERMGLKALQKVSSLCHILVLPAGTCQPGLLTIWNPHIHENLNILGVATLSPLGS